MPPSRSPTPTKRVACTNCRQAKLRCDGSHTATCIRCARLNLSCEKNTGYRRVSKRSKIDELEKQVQVLQQNVAAAQRTPTHSAAPILSWREKVEPVPPMLAPEPEHIDMDVAEGEAEREVAAAEDTGRLPALLARTLDATSMSPPEIDALFTMSASFFAENHPYLPVLSPTESPDSIHAASPLLFWTILSIASSHANPALYTSITALAWSSVTTLHLPLPCIHALLLQSMFPTPAIRLTSDPGPSLTALAVTAATTLSMPPTPQSCPPATWAACAIVAEHMSANFGTPPLLSASLFSRPPCRPLPATLQHLYALQRLLHRAAATLPNCPECLPLFEADLATLTPIAAPPVATLHQLAAALALQLQTRPLTPRTLAATSAFLRHAAAHERLLRASPGWLIRTLLAAAGVLWRMQPTTGGCTVVDVAALLRACGRVQGDMAWRAAALVAGLKDGAGAAAGTGVGAWAGAQQGGPMGLVWEVVREGVAAREKFTGGSGGERKEERVEEGAGQGGEAGEGGDGGDGGLRAGGEWRCAQGLLDEFAGWWDEVSGAAQTE
ncbi:hypothetical protein EDC01DRAFT_755801 [Geopyxis carbonaria]|nr:hypothetical protein EDC01DRAFT_755801 [Geopyxis carbonaria]